MFRILSNDCRDGTIKDDPATGAQTVEVGRVRDNKLCVPAGDGPSLCSHGPWAMDAGERSSGDDAFAWPPRRDQDGMAARRSGSTRPSSSQDLVLCDEAPRVLVEGWIWDDKAWGSVLGCVGSAPGTCGEFGWAGEAGRRAGGLLINGAWDACSHEASQDCRMVDG